MVPPGFYWKPFVDGLALHLGKRIIAQIASAWAGQCRVTTNPSLAGRLVRFLPDEASAMAYVDAWARIWEPQLRRIYSRGLAKPGLRPRRDAREDRPAA